MFAKTRPKAEAAFSRFVLERLGEGKREDLYKVADSRFTGDDDFVEGLALKLGDAIGKSIKLSRDKKFDIGKVLFEVASCFGLDEADIRSKSQTRNITGARHTFVYIAKEKFGFASRDIAKLLNKDESGIGYSVQRIRNNIARDESIKGLVEEIYGRLI